LYFITKVTVTNTTASPVENIYYMRNVDPDQGVFTPRVTGGTGDYYTYNSIVYQNPNACNRALASATANADGTGYLGLGSIDSRAKVTTGGFSNRSASNIWNGLGGLTQSGTNLFRDEAISIAFNLGTLNPNQSATFAYAYILGESDLDKALAATNIGVNIAGIPVDISQTNDVCSGSPTAIELTNVGTYTNWTWSPSTGLNTTTGTSITTNITNPITYIATGVGTCGIVNLNIPLNPISVPIPANAESFTGPSSISVGQSNITYTIPKVENATSYIWSLPTGAIITSESNTNSITFNASNTGWCGNIKVAPQNVCGAGLSSEKAICVTSPFGITLSSNLTVSSSATVAQFGYTFVTGNPTVYSIYWDATSIANGFTNIANQLLPASSIGVPIPSGLSSGVYTGILYVGDMTVNSIGYPISVTILNTPTITSFSPTSAIVGNSITITGAAFSGITGVSIGGLAATYTLVDDSHIIVTVPNGASSGDIVVTTAIGTVTTSGINIVTMPAPIVTVNGAVPAASVPAGACYYQNSFAFSVNNLDASATYIWDFGDGTVISNTASPTHSYTTTGNFKVHVVATIGNVSTSVDQFVNVYPTPTPSFNVYAGAGNGNAYSFQSSANVASGYIASYTWDFGDGTGDIGSNPTKTYGTAGTYPVKLIVTSDNGCKDSVTQNVTITKTGTAVNAAFDVNTASQCISNNSFTFTNTSITGSDVTYLWNFGDGSATSNSYHTSHVYTTANTYTVTLTLTKGTDISTAVKTITVAPQPTVSFTATVNNNVVNFIPTASITSGSITSYQWDFGDNSYSAVQSPTHTYTAANTYNVKLVVISASGCSSAVASQDIAVIMPVVATPPPATTPDVPSFTASGAQCVLGNNYTFTNTSVINGTGVTYSWDFGDNSAPVITANTTHVYTNAGTYNVRLTVTSSAGTSVTNQAVVVYAQPSANFNITNNGNAYTFYNTSSIAAGSIASAAWISSDGGNGTGNQYTQTFTPGDYYVKLNVISDNGCSAEITKSFTNAPPLTATFSVSGTALNSCYAATNSFVFTNTSTTGAGINYLWDFGDGTTATSYNTTHQYTKAGSYIVRLTVSKNNQTVYATPVTIALNPTPAPEFLLYLNTTLTSLSSEVKRCFTPGMDFSFISSSTVQSGQMHYKWSFATNAIHFRDGDSVDYINPRIVFDTAGIYPVKLVVSTDNGCADSVTHVIKLGHPHAHYQTLVDYGGDKYANPTVTYTNDSYDHQLAITNWQWNFGNGVGSTLQNPTSFQYTCGGTYNASLRITDEIPCTSDTTSVVVIRIRPHALYSVSAPNYTPDVYAQPTYSFTDNTTVNDGCPDLRYNWNFGDGYTSTAKNPTHVFKGSGVYDVRLIVTNLNGGLKDTITQQVMVAIKPKAGFSTSQSLIPDVYASPTVAITNSTSSTDTAAPASALLYAWNFGDGSAVSNAISPNHVYASGGTYTITLTVTNPISGLTDVTTKTVNIVIKPKADFTVGAAVFSPDVYAQPSYTFTNASSVNDASGSLTYAWNFGDGTALSNATSPSHTYTASGTYLVSLVVTNTNGAVTDTKTATVVVAIKPKASFTANVTHNTGGYPVVSVVNNSTVNETATLTYGWTYGDGIGTSSSATPTSYTYSAGAASRTITLVVTNPNSGLTDTYTLPLSNMYILPVNVAYSVPTTGLTVNYTASATDNSGGTLSYSWNFNAGAGSTSNTASGAYAFAAAGTYNASLTVTSSNGGSVTISPIAITVTNPAPVARINIQVTNDAYALRGRVPSGTTFNVYFDGAQSTAASGKSITNYHWSFDYIASYGHWYGASNLDRGSNPYINASFPWVTTAANFSMYTIQIDGTLTVTDNTGLQDSKSVSYIHGQNGTGYTTIYDPVAISNGGNSNFKINPSLIYAYPNPVVDDLTVTYKTPFSGAVVINIYDMSGKLVKQQNANAIGNNQLNTSRLHVSSLPKGVYSIEVNINGAKLFSSQLIKAQ